MTALNQMNRDFSELDCLQDMIHDINHFYTLLLSPHIPYKASV